MTLSSNFSKFSDVITLSSNMFSDVRGYALDLNPKLSIKFKNELVSKSWKGVLRGMHFQIPTKQGKLISVLHGHIFDVIVDLRKGSNTFKEWAGMYIKDSDKVQIYIPEGFAHGFLAISDVVIFHYKMTDVYVPTECRTLKYNDPTINIKWPSTPSILSDSDAKGMSFKELENRNLLH